MREKVGSEKLAVRCSAQELKAIDAFVVAGDYRNRSSVIRTALVKFLSAELKDLSEPRELASGPVVNITPEEKELIGRYAKLVHGGNIADALAMLVRYGLVELKVDQRVKDSEERQRNAPVLTNAEEMDRVRHKVAAGESQDGGERHPAKKGW